ncbi:MAG: aldo/keto reductase [Aestuariivirga sp.]|uniref:aldo/keto reductase n=1 Tax=Aestuariivirga sp. TaxID=2650926 RepID=UPI0025BC57D8|nr:aldo/keto reductase [Aestuariivirga sp.]MCA3561531.1 aldo/keto reductase [Aestuariivirga sp.]
MDRFNGIPAIGLGTYPLSGAEAERCVATALEVGIRHVDTAQMYGNEAQVGRGIAASGVARGDIFLVTKVDPSNLGADRFADSVKRSVDKLGTAPDLLLIHWPPADGEIDGPVERLLHAGERAMAKQLGVSNFSPRLMRRAQALAGGKLICNQIEFHPLLDQSAWLATARELNMVITAYSPLARGKCMEEKVVQEIAARHRRPASEIVLRWIIQQGVAAIPMTRKRGNAASNLRAAEFTLTPDEMDAISALGSRNLRLINPSWMRSWD